MHHLINLHPEVNAFDGQKVTCFVGKSDKCVYTSKLMCVELKKEVNILRNRVWVLSVNKLKKERKQTNSHVRLETFGIM